jgi:hypothetical protein
VWGAVALNLAQPLTLIVISANISSVVTMCLSLHTIVVNRRFPPPELRPPLWREAALVLTAAFYGLFALMAALATWSSGLAVHRRVSRARRLAFVITGALLVAYYCGTTCRSAESSGVPAATAVDYFSSAGPDADSAFVVRIEPETSGDIFLLSLSGAFPPRRVLATPAYDGGPQLSPDGHWLLCQSNPSGQTEIFVRRYPALDRPYPVSAGGGFQARWSRSGREIYYRSGQRMIAVSVDTSGAEPVFGTPATLFTSDYGVGIGVSIPNYDVTSDGRFIMLRRGAGGGALHVVIDWADELKRMLESGGR